MEFLKERVFTALNADELKVGSKGYFADSLGGLRTQVEQGNTELKCLTAVTNDFNMSRFCTGSSAFTMFYLAEEPQEKKFRPYKDTDEMINHFYRHFNLIPQEYHLPMIWIKAKGVEKNKYLITRFSENDIVTMTFEKCVYSTNLRVLSDDYTYLDGSPCGIEE